MSGRSRMGGQTGRGRYRASVSMDPPPERVAAAIRKMGYDFADWRPAWIKIAPVVQQGFLDNIASRGATLGERWDALTAKYAARKQRDGYPRTELRRTGVLVASLTSASGVKMTPQRLTVGTSAPYARAMQYGFSGSDKTGYRRGSGRRPFVGFSDAMRTRAVGIMSERAKQIVDAAAADIGSGSTAGLGGVRGVR